ncbi:MAG: ferritin-like domain-containing protein [Oligoflexus sp.]
MIQYYLKYAIFLLLFSVANISWGNLASDDHLSLERDTDKLVSQELEKRDDVALLDMLYEAIQDEYLSYHTYLNVIERLGSVRPFVNILNAEARHIEAISGLYRARELAVPESNWNLNNVPIYETRQEACGAAVIVEIENISMYDRFLSQELPFDVELVFQELRLASLERHLPAFSRCQ